MFVLIPQSTGWHHFCRFLGHRDHFESCNVLNLIKKEWPELKISEEIVTSYLAASIRLVGGDCHLWEMNTISEGNLHRPLAGLP